jgi:hypothetical protein
MHGIIRTRMVEGGVEAPVEPKYTHIRRVMVRYTDGRTLVFVPEAGREEFSEDDMLELAKVLGRASSIAEWSEVEEIAGS